MKVYIVDSEIFIREKLKNSIEWEREGIIYSGDAASGEKALLEMIKLKPDLLITDIRLPGMNGFELCTRVRQAYPEIKILIYSSSKNFEYVREAMKIGVSDYLVKPISVHELAVAAKMTVEQVYNMRKHLA